MRFRGMSVILLVVLPSLASCQDEQPAGSPSEEREAEVAPGLQRPPSVVLPDPPRGPIGHGVVYYADGTPLVGGQVLACFGFGLAHGNPMKVIETKTDARGMFQCDPPEGDTSGYVHLLVRDGKGNYASRQRHRSPRDPYMTRLVLEEEKFHKVRVVDENDQPQPGAIVHVTWGFGKRLASKTDANGEAFVLALQSNEGLIANVPGEGIAHQSNVSFPVFGQRKDSQTTELKLEKAAQREVVVRDIDGEPLVGAEVEVLSLSGVYTPLNSCWHFRTDQQGRATFDLPVLNGGLVVVDMPGYQRVRVPFRIFYPRTGQLVTHRDVTLPELVTLRGHVQIDPAVKVPEGHSPDVRVTYSGLSRWKDTVTGSRTVIKPGEFEIQVPVDSYLKLNADQAGVQSDPVFLTVLRGKQPGDVQFTIQPMAKIRGQVLVAHTEQPTSDRTVRVFKTAPDWPRQMKEYFQQHPLPDSPPLPMHWFQYEVKVIQCDEQGTFEFETPAGRYGLQEAASKDGTEVIVEPGETVDVIVWKDPGVD